MPQRVERCAVVAASNRNNEVAATAVPAGHDRSWTALRFRIKLSSQAGSLTHCNEVPSVQMQCRMTASFRATASFLHSIAFGQSKAVRRSLTRKPADDMRGKAMTNRPQPKMKSDIRVTRKAIPDLGMGIRSPFGEARRYRECWNPRHSMRDQMLSVVLPSYRLRRLNASRA